MSIDHSWGVGYGIAVPVEDFLDCPELTGALARFFGMQPGDEGVYDFDGAEQVYGKGLLVDTAGNEMNGEQLHALILDVDTVSKQDRWEQAGVNILDKNIRRAEVLANLSEVLFSEGIYHTNPSWLYYSSIY